MLALAFVLERLDEMLLSAVYQPLGAALHASPSQLGALSLCRALLQVLRALSSNPACVCTCVAWQYAGNKQHA